MGTRGPSRSLGQAGGIVMDGLLVDASLIMERYTLPYAPSTDGYLDVSGLGMVSSSY